MMLLGNTGTVRPAHDTESALTMQRYLTIAAPCAAANLELFPHRRLNTAGLDT